MFTVTLICVGKLKEKYLMQAGDEYVKRLTPYCKMQIRQIPEQRRTGASGAAETAAALEKEGQAVLAAIPDKCRVIALCIEGQGLSSEAFAEYMESCAVAGDSKVCFIIGGSDGLSPAVKQRADLRLSLSEMTYPHHLARVLLLEQIYRAFMIRAGTKYHSPS